MLVPPKKALTVLPTLEAWDGKMAWDDAKETQARHKTPPPKPLSRSAKVILELLRRAQESGLDDGWVDHDLLAEHAKIRAVHSRAAEIRRHGYNVQNNGRRGGRSQYRLVPPDGGA